ncbi:MAG: hypothetical protein DLM68_08840 [Hyphomicrobiales bacterium]|nr:MAG: hypothetical protein DLM68_08840 [Hyphomicrobiales bacterium]
MGLATIGLCTCAFVVQADASTAYDDEIKQIEKGVQLPPRPVGPPKDIYRQPWDPNAPPVWESTEKKALEEMLGPQHPGRDFFNNIVQKIERE